MQMTETFYLLLWIAWPPIAAWLVLKLIPSSIAKFIEKEIERRSDTKLERVKAEIQSSYSTLKTSVDVLTASNSGMHPHIIESVSSLWGTIVTMREQFGSLVAFDSIVLRKEASEAFADQDASPYTKLLEFVRLHEGDLQNPIRAANYFSAGLDNHRLFCGDRLWLIFYVLRAVMLRASILIAWSFEKREFQDWRKDAGVKQLLESVLPEDFVEQVRNSIFNGLSTALARLEAEFLHEAARVMSGSKAMADSLADVQAIMLLQNAKVAEQAK